MAVADAALPSPHPPPPARIVVAVLALVHFSLAPMLALGRLHGFVIEALPFLCLAVAWVISAFSAAKVVARHAWGEDSAPFLVLQALTFKVLICSFLVLLALASLLLSGLCVEYLIAALSGSSSEVKKGALGAITRDSSKLPLTAVLGFMASLPFILLVVAGFVVAGMSHVEGSVSHGEMVGLVIADVGTFAMYAISCFLTIPALALHVWRERQADRKAPLQFC